MSVRIAGGCLVAVAAGLFVYGCGSRSCGPGTTEVEGECVPESSRMCADGTVDVDGVCVPEEVTECGPGTTLNADTGACDPDIAECAPGTVVMGSECVPDGSVICADGSAYDAATGTCVISDGACGEGAVLIDGECLPDDAALVPDVASVEPDDPERDGTPVPFTLPAEGAETTLGGCIEPADLDADGSLDPDVDFFEVEVTDATLLRVNADGLGGAAAAFAVFPEEGSALADAGWFRVGINLVGDTSARQVYLPDAGTYTVQVFDSRSVALESLVTRGVFGFARAVGAADTCYHVTVEHLALPSPTSLAPGERVGMLSDRALFFAISPSAAASYLSRLSDDSPTTFVGQSARAGGVVNVGQGLLATPSIEAGASARLVVDHVVSLALDPVQYTLELTELGAIPGDGRVSVTHDAATDPGVFYRFDATAGDVVRFAFDGGTEALEVAVFGPAGADGVAPCGVASGRPDPEPTCEAWYVVRQSGTQLVRVFHPTATDGAVYDVDFDIAVQTPADLVLGTPSTLTFTDARAYARVDLSSTAWATFEASGLAGTGFSAADVDVFGDATLVLSRTDEGGTFDSTPLRAERGVVAPFAQIYGPDFGPEALIQVRDPGGFDGDESLSLEVRAEPVIDVTVDPMTPAARTGDAVPAGGFARYLVQGVAGGTLTFEVTGTGGTDPFIDRLDDESIAVESRDDTFADGVESIEVRIPRRGWLAFRVGAASGGTVDVAVSQTPPPYTVSAGTTAFTSVCPSEGGAGATLPTLDDGSGFGALDEGLSDVTTFGAFAGFEYFGVPVSGFRASTNGWLTFQTTYTGTARFFNAPLGTPGEPNDLVAPMWTDLVLTRLCVLEEATRYVVEWAGRDFPGTGQVEMQVILRDDASIEFVYGSGHTLPEGSATVGLENADASLVIDPDLSVAAGTSILFTRTP